MTELGRITPKKVPAHEAHHADDEKPTPVGVWKFFIAFGIILLVMVGFYWWTHYRDTTEADKNRYNGYDFKAVDGGLWVTRIQVGAQPYDIPFYYHPRDTLTVLIDPAATIPLVEASPKQVYISVDPDGGPQPVIAAVEISRITGNKYNLLNYETHGALSRTANGTKADLPVVSCKDATTDIAVVQFIPGDKNVILRSDKYPNCVLLQYTNSSESIRVADRYAYMLLQIMH